MIQLLLPLLVLYPSLQRVLLTKYPLYAYSLPTVFQQKVRWGQLNPCLDDPWSHNYMPVPNLPMEVTTTISHNLKRISLSCIIPLLSMVSRSFQSHRKTEEVFQEKIMLEISLSSARATLLQAIWWKGLETWLIRVQMPVQLITKNVALGKLLNPSVPQIPSCITEDNKS